MSIFGMSQLDEGAEGRRSSKAVLRMEVIVWKSQYRLFVLIVCLICYYKYTEYNCEIEIYVRHG
jgi:hypothetical protein